ncbi:hypothetical protein T484DRAFT_1818780, partial [Baffinella frigidus]
KSSHQFKTGSVHFDLLKKSLSRLGCRTAMWLASEMLEANCGHSFRVSSDRQEIIHNVKFSKTSHLRTLYAKQKTSHLRTLYAKQKFVSILGTWIGSGVGLAKSLP